MLVGEIIERINNGDKMPAIAAELGVSKDTLSRRLKAIGYKYNNSSKQQEFIGEGEPPIDINIMDLIQSPAKSNTSVTPVIPSNKDTAEAEMTTEETSPSVTAVIQSNTDKINDVTEVIPGNTDNVTEVTQGNTNRVTPVISSNAKGNTDVTSVTPFPFTSEEIAEIKALLIERRNGSIREADDSLSLNDKVKSMDRGQTVRRTFIVDELILKEVDQLAKEERITKSDIVHLALLELLEQYKK